MAINNLFKFPVLLFILLGCVFCGCSGCSSSDDTPDGTPPPDTGPKEVYDIKLSDIHIRDPFILVDKQNKVYYLHVNGDKKVKVYKSEDLTMWKDMGFSFVPQPDFWGKSDFWAPDVYHYNGKYYVFITLSAPGVKRGTSILVSDAPQGPFVPLVNNAVTPSNWMCLDGSFYVDATGTPWIVYCHEWLEAGDGEILAQQLDKDLKATVGDPKLLFKASAAPWVGPIKSGSVTGNVTDAPFIHKIGDGSLIMLWSSFRKDGKYAIGQAVSKSGSLSGPWEQSSETLNSDDGGHAMLFEDLKGRLMISYHAPNSGPTRAVMKEVYINNGKIILAD
ncbi:glycoside hydrolase family 43 protein [Limibacterium fermenti]|uniref:glycoside hydrolase family 43 protein n=1 Tax=Limibacterium fermenti TaxID=3229863 RepID=UPI000E929898|nr:glycosyl hydrolase family 43 [Porphyromonadaceae bacterium]